ncbi:FGGY-family carbohydrate kinase [Chitinophaga sp. 30R24]|uniref:FGGY-family carbohydrate kinase n=1 Tax=Chitinophaga sp. 30R24 TaxID=3248838 RepID=UPI003B92105E
MYKYFLVVDIGTGNARVAVVRSDGEVTGVARGDIQYHRDPLYPDAIYFKPDLLWEQVTGLAQEALQQAGKPVITAITSTSQREGIVLIGKDGKSMIGLPNIDHRGREWENEFADKNKIYQLSGRYPGSLFSVYKLEGIRRRRQEIWQEIEVFVSISDWVGYQFTGIAAYEHSQASETLLYDVEKGGWSDELCEIFHFDKKYLPPLAQSCSITGPILEPVANTWNISKDAVMVTGGGDTQLAVKSTQPAGDDFVIVSGTTTPIVKLAAHYVTDEQQRTWTNRDVEHNRFIFEANAGVTGLNLQRLKEIFYPNEGYEVMERELQKDEARMCMASLGSLVASDRSPVVKGGFIFPVPVSHELSRSSFIWAALLDIGFSIAENFNVLKGIVGHTPDYIWACGGGLQSGLFRQVLADILDTEVRVRYGFSQSSAIGGALICNAALGINDALVNTTVEAVVPDKCRQQLFEQLYAEWKHSRHFFRQLS